MSDPTTTLNTDFRTHLVAVDRHTEQLLATARSLDPGSLGQPSLCPGWTRGHVLTHIARNADALVNLLTNATTGSSTPMYASPDSREADIEAGAGRPLAEQEASAARVAAAAAGLSEDLSDTPLLARNNTKVRAGYLPFMRMREVVMHHIDLDAGFSFVDVDDEVLLALLQDTVRRLRHDPETPSMSIRTNEGDVWSIGDGRPLVSGTRAAVLAWLTRGDTSNVVGSLPAIPSLG